MSYVLKKFAKNLLSGKSIMDISLPVTIFSEVYTIFNLGHTLNYWLGGSELLHYFSNEQRRKITPSSD